MSDTGMAFEFRHVREDSCVIVGSKNVDLDAEELIQLFKDFMLAVGYQPKTVTEYLGD